MDDIKFEPIHTWPERDQEIMVVGQNPGRQRKSAQTFTAWEGNRSGDFMQEIVKGIPGLYLTNVCNYQEMTPERIEEGLSDLRAYYSENDVKKVVCLGLFAADHVKKAGLPVDVIMHHPSFVLRFNKGKENYKAALRKELLS